MYRHTLFFLHVKERNVIFFTEGLETTDFVGFGGLISYPGTFHDHQIGKTFFLKIFYDSGDYLRVSGAAPVGFHGGDQVWLDADPHIVQTKF